MMPSGKLGIEAVELAQLKAEADRLRETWKAFGERIEFYQNMETAAFEAWNTADKKYWEALNRRAK